ncbi:MAG: orotate phosphoribosyltransferase [Candidatus Poseidoniaceae archaeon]|jgi:orotate phosphoribosyltransferase|nr:orotate phosphoribosyltransferase [Candidatus Poseidoniaceae archaeon]
MGVHESLRSNPDWQSLVEFAKDLSYMRSEGELFTLASGRQSPHFFDLKPLMMHPQASIVLGRLLNQRLDDLAPDFVGGLELGAVPLTAIAISTAGEDSTRRGFMVRKEPKGRGGRKTTNPAGIEGTGIMDGGKIVVLEDVTTTGGSSLKAVARIHQTTPCEVIGVITVIDRQEGGAEAYANAGVAFESLVDLSDIVE